MTDETDTEQKAVKTYVPAYQKEAWREHADDLEMTQSEFVKVMVQAGRRDFDLAGESHRTDSVDETPGVEGLEDRVLGILEDDRRSWEDLVGALTEDIEDRLETTLQELQRENRVQYSGRHGGYTIEDADGD